MVLRCAAYAETARTRTRRCRHSAWTGFPWRSIRRAISGCIASWASAFLVALGGDFVRVAGIPPVNQQRRMSMLLAQSTRIGRYAFSAACVRSMNQDNEGRTTRLCSETGSIRYLREPYPLPVQTAVAQNAPRCPGFHTKTLVWRVPATSPTTCWK